MADDLLTIAEAAQRLRVSVRTVEREHRDGRLAIVRIRSRRKITDRRRPTSTPDFKSG